MTDNTPSISTRARVSPLWIIPVVAVVAGIWMVVQSYLAEGPTITIDFQTAEGLAAGKTKVKMRSVDVGLVEDVTLTEDMEGVKVTVSLDREVAPLLRDDTKFWVVRARIGAGGISGINTLLSGGYIQLAPGTGSDGKRQFVGLENPPRTPVAAPGTRLSLASVEASISAGDPIIYEGFKVGRIESMTFDPQTRRAHYDIFIDAPYNQLVNENTRFWNTSGFGIDASAAGVRFEVGTIDTVLLGGVAFGTPPGMAEGEPTVSGAEFTLYRSYQEILESPYEQGTYYVVSFRQSLAGLVVGAPVTYRGIQLGRVERILIKELTAQGIDAGGDDIPVLLYIEPGRVSSLDTSESVEAFRRSIETSVDRGLRATLLTGNLLTGRKLINLDFFENLPEAQIGQFDQWVTIPSIETGVGEIQEQISTLLAKLNSLPLDQTVSGANRTLDNTAVLAGNLNKGVVSLNKILASDSTQALPNELASVLEELRSVLDGFSQDAALYQDANASLSSLARVLENLDRLTRQLSDRPNSILFSSPPKEDPVPEPPQ